MTVHVRLRADFVALKKAIEDHFQYEGFYDPVEKLEELNKLINSIEYRIIKIDPTYVSSNFPVDNED